MKTPNAEVRGDAPLYGAASLSTDGFGEWVSGATGETRVDRRLEDRLHPARQQNRHADRRRNVDQARFAVTRSKLGAISIVENGKREMQMRPGWIASQGAGVNLFALRYYLIRAYRRKYQAHRLYRFLNRDQPF